jgi:hypothetical protein
MPALCAKCGAELAGDDLGALDFTLDIGPGVRGPVGWSTVTTRARFALCAADTAALAFAIAMAAPVPEVKRTRCTVLCQGHRQGLVHMVSGAASESARCPNCHGRADVEVEAGPIVPHMRWWRRVLLRKLAAV